MAINGDWFDNGMAGGFDPLGLSWGMFEASGNPAYYLLYRDLFDSDVLFDDEEEDERFR